MSTTEMPPAIGKPFGYGGYFDNNATTAPFPDALKIMNNVALNCYGNPSGLYTEGRTAKKQLEYARSLFAKGLDVPVNTIFFSSTGTEANNIIIRGAMSAIKKQTPQRNIVITSTVEHSSVAYTCQTCGFTSIEIPCDQHGTVNLNAYRNALITNRANIAMISIIYAQNEVGTIQPITNLVAIKNEILGDMIPFHTDMTQILGKSIIHPRELGVDFITGSAHKFHGPRGVGIMYMSNPTMLKSETNPITGGGQESGMRPGTENVSAIVGAAHAFNSMIGDRANHEERKRHITGMKTMLIGRLRTYFPKVVFHGHPQFALYNTINMSIPLGLSSRVIADRLDEKGFSVSTGSACALGTPSRILRAMNVPDELIDCAFRISLSENNTMQQCEKLMHEMRNVYIAYGVRI